MEKSKVFISCGQKTREEKEIGLAVRQWLVDNGFDPYFAESFHTPEALTTHIFKALEDSDYFISINFKRDESCAGSIFVQQELAIASYLKIPLLPFHQEGIDVKGISKYQLINSYPFKNKEDIIGYLTTYIPNWNKNTRNQLFLTFEHHNLNFITNIHTPTGIISTAPADWYHITVRNGSKSKYVKNCYGYLQSIHKVILGSISEENLVKHNVELLWAGVGSPNIHLPSLGRRDLDAFYFMNLQNTLYFNQRSFSGEYRYPDITGDGEYRITYVIISDNMPTAYFEIHLKIDNQRIIIISSNQVSE